MTEQQFNSTLNRLDRVAEAFEKNADNTKRIADFLDSLHTTDKGRVGTNDYATYVGNATLLKLLKAIHIELQKSNGRTDSTAPSNY